DPVHLRDVRVLCGAPVSGRVNPTGELDSAVLDALRAVGVGTVDGLHDRILTGVGRGNADQRIALVLTGGKRRRIPWRRKGTPRFFRLFFAVLLLRGEELVVVGLVQPEEETAVFALGLDEFGEPILARMGFLGRRGRIGRLGVLLLGRVGVGPGLLLLISART